MEVVEVFGKKIPVYGLLGGIGVVLGIVYLLVACRVRKKSFDNAIYVYIWACLFAMLGAKLLYLIVESGNIVRLISGGEYSLKEIASAFMLGGFVFYGGLFGALFGAWLASRYFSLPALEQINLCIPVVPLIHGFGRIGCHLVGCCYGVGYSGVFSIAYESSNYAPNGVGLFPVQLCEAVFDFILFGVMLVFMLKKKHEDKFVYIYLIAYSVVRFSLEFLRGDARRGSFIGLSTSQWISILMWICLLGIRLWNFGVSKTGNDKQ